MPTTSTRTRRDLVLASIEDIQGSVHANDSKSAAILIVHGLFFTGVMTVTSRLGRVFTMAPVGARTAVAAELGFALLFFLASVLLLLWAVVPYRPSKAFIDRNRKSDPHPPDFFYPEPGSLAGSHGRSETRVLLDRLEGLTEPAAEAGLVYEVVKIQDIQLHEARFARIGFRLFLLETVFVTTYLVTVGVLALVYE